MNTIDDTASGYRVDEVTIAQLVGEVYDSAPVQEQGHMLEQLLRPLGLLALLVVADGVFAKIRFHAGWQNMQVQLEDLRQVHGSDVVALAERVQQVGLDALDGFAQVLAASPVLTGSAAAIVLVQMLMPVDKRHHD